jgi:hypothetical protein
MLLGRAWAGALTSWEFYCAKPAAAERWSAFGHGPCRLQSRAGAALRALYGDWRITDQWNG